MLTVAARRRFGHALAGFATLLCTSAARAEPPASDKRPLVIDGISVAPHGDDLLGLARIKFQGLVASQLREAGYRVATLAEDRGDALTLVGLLKEEVCDDQDPPQCRVAIRWQLEDRRGVVIYRTTTRAVDQAVSPDVQRRGLVLSALRSLLQRPRFALQLTDFSPATRSGEALGFRRCERPPLELPRAARSVAAALVSVQSGSNLAAGAIVSPDGLVLTSAGPIDEHAPLQARFAAGQTLPAEIVALDRAADVALLRVRAHTDSTCLPLRDSALSAGMPAFGVGSEPGQPGALSLSAGAVQSLASSRASGLLRVDARIARAQGGPLLDEHGQLWGLVSAPRGEGPAPDSSFAVAAAAALAALSVRPADATDPRLTGAARTSDAALGFVQDADDPPFVLTERYTYGTSRAAHTLRTSGAVVAGVGAFGVFSTWFSYRATPHPSSGAHRRLVVTNDVCWALLGLGAVGVGVSYALPEGHTQVAVGVERTASRELFLRIGSGGLELGAEL